MGGVQQREMVFSEERGFTISIFGALSNVQRRFSPWSSLPPAHRALKDTLAFPPLSSSLLSFMCKRSRDGGDGVCQGRVWDCAGQGPGRVLQNEEHAAGSGGQEHHRLGPVAGHQGCKRVSAFFLWAHLTWTWAVCTQAGAASVVYGSLKTMPWIQTHCKAPSEEQGGKPQVDDYPAVTCSCCCRASVQPLEVSEDDRIASAVEGNPVPWGCDERLCKIEEYLSCTSCLACNGTFLLQTREWMT